MFFRAFYADASNLQPPVDLIEKTKIYPLKGDARPMKFPDASGIPANMLPISDVTAFDQLKKLVDARGRTWLIRTGWACSQDSALSRMSRSSRTSARGASSTARQRRRTR